MSGNGELEIESDGGRIPEERLQRHIRRLDREVNRYHVLAFLEDMPQETHEDFYRQLTRLLNIEKQRLLEEHLLEILDSDSLDTERDPEAVRFTALYYLKTYYRRNFDVQKCVRFYESYEDEFGDRIMYRFGNVIILGLKEEYEAAIRENLDIIEELGENKDVLHELPHNVATGYEEGKLPENRREEYFEEAIEKIDKVLTLDPDYGRYPYTKGRLMALQGNYKSAKKLIESAIEKENHNRFDYGLRISMYQSKLSQVYAEEYRNELESQLQNAREDINEAQRDVENRTEELESRFLQFLGFFSGIIAIIIASAQIGAQYPLLEATQFIALLISGLLVAFSGLGLLLPTQRFRRKVLASIVVFLMGMISFYIALIYLPAYL